jgi:DNA helicase-2/ATP-dependent DNA helicase PcrA
VVRARERNRHVGRPISRRAVGSTLLLKGLEADVAVVLNPAAMDARHLYVALTRGAKRLVVCSQTPLLTSA